VAMIQIYNDTERLNIKFEEIDMDCNGKKNLSL